MVLGPTVFPSESSFTSVPYDHLVSMSPSKKTNHCGIDWCWYHKDGCDEAQLFLRWCVCIFDLYLEYFAFVCYKLVLGDLSESLDGRTHQNTCCVCLGFWQNRNHSTANMVRTRQQQESVLHQTVSACIAKNSRLACRVNDTNRDWRKYLCWINASKSAGL